MKWTRVYNEDKSQVLIFNIILMCSLITIILIFIGSLALWTSSYIGKLLHNQVEHTRLLNLDDALGKDHAKNVLEYLRIQNGIEK